jgi:hypothetical protein
MWPPMGQHLQALTAVADSNENVHSTPFSGEEGLII